jgi:hypothetical protein
VFKPIKDDPVIKIRSLGITGKIVVKPITLFGGLIVIVFGPELVILLAAKVCIPGPPADPDLNVINPVVATPTT